MTKVTTSVVAIALSIAATAAIAQTTPNPNNSLVASPSANDPAIRGHLLATLKTGSTGNVNGGNSKAAAAAGSSSVALALTATRAVAARP